MLKMLDPFSKKVIEFAAYETERNISCVLFEFRDTYRPRWLRCSISKVQFWQRKNRPLGLTQTVKTDFPLSIIEPSTFLRFSDVSPSRGDDGNALFDRMFARIE